MRLSEQIIEAVAEEEGIEASEIDEPLFGALDTDALDKLYRAEAGSIVFTWRGHEVRAYSGGTVQVDPLE